jgi:TetR/AcrR family transcriptional repressor of bet genes
MPLIVDRDARRREVARVATRLIADKGLDGASVRAIARAAGTSTTVVSHYFHNKRELLLFAYVEAMTETVTRARRRRDRGGSLAWCIEAILPLDERRRNNWKIWFAFWGMAVADPEFMRQQQDSGRDARRLFAELIGATSGRSPDDCDTEARRLLVTVAGLATQATYDPADWSPARQRAILTAEIETFAKR